MRPFYINAKFAFEFEEIPGNMGRGNGLKRNSAEGDIIIIVITTPLMGGEGQNVTVHFNVCKTSRLEN